MTKEQAVYEVDHPYDIESVVSIIIYLRFSKAQKVQVIINTENLGAACEILVKVINGMAVEGENFTFKKETINTEKNIMRVDIKRN